MPQNNCNTVAAITDRTVCKHGANKITHTNVLLQSIVIQKQLLLSVWIMTTKFKVNYFDMDFKFCHNHAY